MIGLRKFDTSTGMTITQGCSIPQNYFYEVIQFCKKNEIMKSKSKYAIKIKNLHNIYGEKYADC